MTRNEARRMYSHLDDETRRPYRDGHGITHLVTWDEGARVWYYVCDVNHEVTGDKTDSTDALVPFPTCLRCMTRTKYP